MGVLTEDYEASSGQKEMFPYPLEETRGSNKTTHDMRGKQVKFPSPTEVNGGSYVTLIPIKYS